MVPAARPVLVAAEAPAEMTAEASVAVMGAGLPSALVLTVVGAAAAAYRAANLPGAYAWPVYPSKRTIRGERLRGSIGP